MGIFRTKISDETLVMLDNVVQNTQKKFNKINAREERELAAYLQWSKDAYLGSYSKSKAMEGWRVRDKPQFDEERKEVWKELKVQLQGIISQIKY